MAGERADELTVAEKDVLLGQQLRIADIESLPDHGATIGWRFAELPVGSDPGVAIRVDILGGIDFHVQAEIAHHFTIGDRFANDRCGGRGRQCGFPGTQGSVGTSRGARVRDRGER